MPINRVLDDWFGLDPNGGGVFDSRTGLLGHQVDITAPGQTVTQAQNPLFQQTSQHISPALGEAQALFQQGPAPLNPLLEGYYNQTAGLLGSDRGDQLARRAAATSAGGFAGAGTLGGARHAAAASSAAARQLEDQAARERQELSLAGQQYQNWQDTADWQNLARYQQATGFGQAVPTTSTVTRTPSGAEIGALQAQAALANAQAQASGQPLPYQQGGGALGTLNTIGQLAPAVSTAWDVGTGIWDTVSGWFDEGGEVNHQVSPRYQRAKARKQGGA